MKEWFLARGYPEIVVSNQIDKVVFGRNESVKKKDLLPFLFSDGEVQKVFSPPPIVSTEARET